MDNRKLIMTGVTGAAVTGFCLTTRCDAKDAYPFRET